MFFTTHGSLHNIKTGPASQLAHTAWFRMASSSRTFCDPTRYHGRPCKVPLFKIPLPISFLPLSTATNAARKISRIISHIAAIVAGFGQCKLSEILLPIYPSEETLWSKQQRGLWQRRRRRRRPQQQQHCGGDGEQVAPPRQDPLEVGLQKYGISRDSREADHRAKRVFEFCRQKNVSKSSLSENLHPSVRFGGGLTCSCDDVCMNCPLQRWDFKAWVRLRDTVWCFPNDFPAD